MKVYQYGVGKDMPDRLPDPVIEQLALQNRFWNALVELENEHQERYNQLVSSSDEELQRIESDIAELQVKQSELRAEIKRKRQKARADVDVGLLQKRIAAKKEELKVLREERKRLRAEIKERIKPQCQELEAQRRAQAKRLRQEFAAYGLYWGNYNAVWDSYNRARQAMFKRRAQGGPSRLNFHRFTGEGRLTVQLQGGLSPQELLSGASGQIQIDPVPEEAWSHPRRGVRRALRRTTGRIRVRSGEGNKPVWFEFPLVLHRPLPRDGRIKQAQLSRKRVGRDWRWRLNITVDEPAAQPRQHFRGEIALDIGWRKLEDAVRIAAWRDDRGRTGEVRLDESYLRVNERLIGLQSTIDGQFETVRALLRDQAHELDPPAWLADALATIPSWRSPNRLASLVDTWADNRFAGDEELFRTLLAWREKHMHLYDWQANLRDKMRARRREEYRIFARWVGENYSRVVLESFDLSRTARRKTPEQGVDSGHGGRHFAKLASPGLLRAEIERVCAETGSRIEYVDAAYTTLTCPACGSRVEVDAARSVRIPCRACGLSYDQDHGAALNILERGSRMKGSEPATAEE
jgi:hypothetical protein